MPSIELVVFLVCDHLMSVRLIVRVVHVDHGRLRIEQGRFGITRVLIRTLLVLLLDFDLDSELKLLLLLMQVHARSDHLIFIRRLVRVLNWFMAFFEVALWFL